MDEFGPVSVQSLKAFLQQKIYQESLCQPIKDSTVMINWIYSVGKVINCARLNWLISSWNGNYSN